MFALSSWEACHCLYSINVLSWHLGWLLRADRHASNHAKSCWAAAQAHVRRVLRTLASGSARNLASQLSLPLSLPPFRPSYTYFPASLLALLSLSVPPLSLPNHIVSAKNTIGSPNLHTASNDVAQVYVQVWMQCTATKHGLDSHN